MGCNIHSYAEVKADDKWEKVGDHFTLDDFDKNWHNKDKGEHPFDWRSYNVFAFLAGVRNYTKCVPISPPRGLPEDVDEEVSAEYESWRYDAHSASYLTLKELLEFEYDQEFCNKRVCYKVSDFISESFGKDTGVIETYRENLGTWFFKRLKELKELGEPENVRIVFWFDN